MNFFSWEMASFYSPFISSSFGQSSLTISLISVEEGSKCPKLSPFLRNIFSSSSRFIRTRGMQSCFSPCIVGTIIKFGCSLASKKFGFTSRTWSFGHLLVSIEVLIIIKLLSGISIPYLLCIIGPFIRTSNDSTRNSFWVISLNVPIGVHPAYIPCFLRKSIPKIQGLIRFLETTKSFLYSFCPILNSHLVIPIGQRLLPLADLTWYVCIGLVVGTIAPVSTRTLHFVCPKVVGIVAPMTLPTVTMFTKRSCLLCFGLGKYISGLYSVWSQIGGSISGSIFISTSISGSFMFAKISYNSVASESPSSKSSSSTSI